MAQTIDLRGQRLVQELAPVLADPSGRRARYLGRAGRAIAVVFLLWLLGLLLAGVGILPAGDLPLGRSVVSQAPRLRSLPRPAQPTRGELLPARAAAGTSTGGAARTRPGFAPFSRVLKRRRKKIWLSSRAFVGATTLRVANFSNVCTTARLATYARSITLISARR